MIAGIMIPEMFAVVRTMFEIELILIPNVSILSCGRTMSRRAHRDRNLRLSVFSLNFEAPSRRKNCIQRFSTLFPGPYLTGCFFLLAVTNFHPSIYLFDATSLYTYVHTSFSRFVGACVFRSSSSVARDRQL